MGKQFDNVEKLMTQAFAAFERMNFQEANRILDAAFAELQALGSQCGVDLAWAEALWQMA